MCPTPLDTPYLVWQGIQRFVPDDLMGFRPEKQGRWLSWDTSGRGLDKVFVYPLWILNMGSCNYALLSPSELVEMILWWSSHDKRPVRASFGLPLLPWFIWILLWVWRWVFEHNLSLSSTQAYPESTTLPSVLVQHLPQICFMSWQGSADQVEILVLSR